MRYSYTLFRKVKIKKMTKPSIGEDGKQQKPSHAAAETIK